MSEQKTSFMQELDLWTEATIIDRLVHDDDEPEKEVGEEVISQIKHAIREKVLDSYKNGLRAGAGAVRKELNAH